jgi:hypothetical protein
MTWAQRIAASSVGLVAARCAAQGVGAESPAVLWPELLADAPLVAVAIWLSRELVRSHREGLEAVRDAHREGLEAVRDAMSGLKAAVSENTRAITSLGRKD